MRYEHADTHVNESFLNYTGYGVEFQKRFRLVAGVSALSFLLLGGAEILIFLGGADILAFLFGHSHSAADLPFQLQTIVIAGLSFGLCILAVSLAPARVMTFCKIVGCETDHLS
jgi:hypothetical protein